MKTIVVTSQKGGSGKTTITAHLAVEIERFDGSTVILVDLDRQGTLSRWHERREKENPGRIDIHFQKLKSGLEKISETTNYCLIDSAPTISDQTSSLVSLADLVVIPVRPSPADLWSVGETISVVKKAGKAFLFVLNQTKSSASITAQAVASLSQHGRVCESFLGDRVLYASSMTGGLTAQEVSPRGPSATEIQRLWQEIKSLIP